MRFLLVAAVALTVSLTASAADPFVGTWKLTHTTEKGGQLGVVRKFEEIPNGVRMTAQGGKHFVDLKADAKEQAPGGGSGTTRTGADARVVKRPNVRTIEVTYRRKGKDVATLRREISDDGRLLTATFDGVDLKGGRFHIVEVSEKQ